MVSRRDENHMHYACMEASKSPCLHKHGCVATINGKIIGRGYNNYRTWSNDQFCSEGCSCHAEIHALRDVWRQFYRAKVSGQLKVV
jgi:tRNA(Arg) A34 adenosine deaminase TadA|tara:strand:+ start:920 stop:1177 length:258 start_codon:yes stop_codon:yes gene_type:complete